ncbi:uncharacterized protein LOC131845169 [Achroia grisella]|uniref:uncharacterized protein LOC131845169 n=1 Tax=Achroia grisella TaxID=688607 RepID=UPI0027D2A9A2|nr:uncharacterized protein LOC131845169 [Achroia grisella]
MLTSLLELLGSKSSSGYAFNYTGKVYEFDNNTIMNCYREHESENGKNNIEDNEESNIVIPVISTAIVLLLLLIILFLYWKSKSQSGRNDSNQENLYATPNVLYADLQEMNASTNTQLKKDDSPYSEIIGILEPKRKEEVHYEEIQMNSQNSKKEKVVYSEVSNKGC